MITLPPPATSPTMYFIGVTTAQSSIMKLFPLWAEALGLGDARIEGIDIGIHAPAEDYRDAVAFIKRDELSLGALVTTHKIDLYNAAGDLFDYLDPYAQAFSELSSISKTDNRLCGHAKDPITAGMALDALLPGNHWRQTGGEVVVLGAGGSALAISAYLAQEKFGDSIPKRIHLTNRSASRLESAKRILANLRVPMSYHLCPAPEDNDRVIAGVAPGSLIANATGLGKDRPGSPVTDDLQFPANGIIWELNYRGTLEFMHQAERQQAAQNLTIADGWTYFLHGWTEVIAEIFHIEMTDERFARCHDIAMRQRQ